MTDLETPICGCMGCTSDARVAIRHPKHGKRAVCAGHVSEHPIVEQLTTPEAIA